MNKTIITGTGILFVLLAIGTVMAFNGNGIQGIDSGIMQQVRTAIENNNFQQWKQLQESTLTEENFNAIRERMQGKTQQREKMQAQNQEIQTAIENQDFGTWKTLMTESNNPAKEAMLSAINEENFYLLSEMHSAMESKDFETAKTIMEELGIQQNGFRGRNKMHAGFGMKENCPFSNPSTE